MAAIDGRQLFDLIRSCQRGQREAIVGGVEDTEGFWQELYVETQEDADLQNFFADEYADDGRILLVTGSAGDGKSALLSRAYDAAGSASDGIPPERINMDATASRRKSEPYHERLDNFLADVMSDVRNGSGPRSAVAINYGLAIDFFQRRGYEDAYGDLWEVLQAAEDQRLVEHGQVSVLNLSHRQTFETHPDTFGQGLLRELVDQFSARDSTSPFHEYYEAERDACPAGEDCPLHRNIEWLDDPKVREQITKLIAAWSVVSGTYLNPRTILDVTSSLIVPPPMQKLASEIEGDVCPVGKAAASGADIPTEVYLWNSLFDAFEWNEPRLSSTVDPAAQETPTANRRVLEWSADRELLHGTVPIPNPETATSVELIRTALRADYLQGGSITETLLDWSWFDEYRAALTMLSEPDSGVDKRQARSVYETIREALRGWTGASKSGDQIEFADGLQSMEYRFFSEWETPQPNLDESQRRSQRETAPGRFWMVLTIGGFDEKQVPLPLTFDLYMLMKKITEGYTPNTTDLDRSEAIRMIQERLSDLTRKDEYVVIRDKAKRHELTIEETGFGVTTDHEVSE